MNQNPVFVSLNRQRFFFFRFTNQLALVRITIKINWHPSKIIIKKKQLWEVNLNIIWPNWATKIKKKNKEENIWISSQSQQTEAIELNLNCSLRQIASLCHHNFRFRSIETTISLCFFLLKNIGCEKSWAYVHVNPENE